MLTGRDVQIQTHAHTLYPSTHAENIIGTSDIKCEVHIYNITSVCALLYHPRPPNYFLELLLYLCYNWKSQYLLAISQPRLG